MAIVIPGETNTGLTERNGGAATVIPVAVWMENPGILSIALRARSGWKMLAVRPVLIVTCPALEWMTPLSGMGLGTVALKSWPAVIVMEPGAAIVPPISRSKSPALVVSEMSPDPSTATLLEII